MSPEANKPRDRPRETPRETPRESSGTKIKHPERSIGAARRTEEQPISLEPEVPVVAPSGPPSGSRKITAFGQQSKHEEAWNRTPNTTGTGAIHVKTFHAKLTDDALVYMDQVINEWLDAHPQYEVKYVTTTVGTLTGKHKEPHLVSQVWV